MRDTLEHLFLSEIHFNWIASFNPFTKYRKLKLTRLFTKRDKRPRRDIRAAADKAARVTPGMIITDPSLF
jgi:hypothetical protein